MTENELTEGSHAESLHTSTEPEAHDPKVPEAWSAFMRQGWGDRELDLPPHPITPYAAARRAKLADTFPGERLVIPAGGLKEAWRMFTGCETEAVAKLMAPSIKSIIAPD